MATIHAIRPRNLAAIEVHREAIEQLIDRLIANLDELDGDCDQRPEEVEEDGTDEPVAIPLHFGQRHW